MQKIAQVVEIEDKVAKIKIARASACGENCSSCGSHCTTKGHVIEVENKDYTIGQLLDVETYDKNLLLYSGIAYGVPLVVMILVIFILHQQLETNHGDLIAALAGILSLGISFYILKLIDSKWLKTKALIKEIKPYKGE